MFIPTHVPPFPAVSTPAAQSEEGFMIAERLLQFCTLWKPVEYFLHLHNYSRDGERKQTVVALPGFSLSNSRIQKSATQEPKIVTLGMCQGSGSHSGRTVWPKEDLSASTHTVTRLCPHCVSYAGYSVKCKFHGGA